VRQPDWNLLRTHVVLHFWLNFLFLCSSWEQYRLAEQSITRVLRERKPPQGSCHNTSTNPRAESPSLISFCYSRVPDPAKIYQNSSSTFWVILITDRETDRQTLGEWKKRSERRKHRALASAKNFRPAADRLRGGAGRPKFNQLEMVTTFTYIPSLVRIDARNSKLSW